MLAICQEILNLVDALAIQDQNFQESKTGRGFWVGRMGSFSLVNQSDNNQSWVLVGSCGVIERVSYLVETGRKSKIGRKKRIHTSNLRKMLWTLTNRTSVPQNILLSVNVLEDLWDKVERNWDAWQNHCSCIVFIQHITHQQLLPSTWNVQYPVSPRCSLTFTVGFPLQVTIPLEMERAYAHPLHSQ